jgi:hypothetical protein
MQSKKSPKDIANAVFSIRAQRKIEQSLTDKCSENEQYIAELENLLKVHSIPLPERKILLHRAKSDTKILHTLLKDGTVEEYKILLEQVKKHHRKFTTFVCYHDLGIWTKIARTSIPTVGNELSKCVCGPGPLNRVDILKGLSGRILPGKLTLLLGPPGSGSMFQSA